MNTKKIGAFMFVFSEFDDSRDQDAWRFVSAIFLVGIFMGIGIHLIGL